MSKEDSELRVTPLWAGEELLVLSVPLEPGLLGLTAAESEIAKALIQGKTNAQIAKERGTSARTVANQLARLFQKLGVSSRTALIVYLNNRRG